MTYFGKDRKRYELGERLGSGGEGDVYRIRGVNGSVAKIYKPERLAGKERQNMRDKLDAMLAANVNPYISGHLVVAWPTDLLLDSKGQFTGFVMPEVTSKKTLLWACREGDRDILFHNKYHWGKSVAIAYNLASAMNLMHSRGIVVGDCNPKNVLVDDRGRVTLIDADSFQLRSQATGKLHRCTVGMPEMHPAELQGRDLSVPGNDYTAATDRFALAVHVFNLLMGFHPFNCVGLNVSRASRSTGSQQLNITRGVCPYVTGSREQPPVGAPDVALLPDAIRALFDRAFGYDAASAVKKATVDRRPSAREWCDALLPLFKSELTQCPHDSHHRYAAHYRKGCPWCDAARRSAAPIRAASGPVVTNRQVHGAATQTAVPRRPAAGHVPVTPPAYTPVRNGSGSAPARPRRSAWLLYLLCIVVGALGAAYPADILAQVVWSNFDLELSALAATLILGGAGALSGAVIAWMASDRYICSRNGWAWMLLSLLAPPAAWVAIALLLLALALVLAVVSAVMGIVGAILLLIMMAGS